MVDILCDVYVNEYMGLNTHVWYEINKCFWTTLFSLISVWYSIAEAALYFYFLLALVNWQSNV